MSEFWGVSDFLGESDFWGVSDFFGGRGCLIFLGGV